MESFDDDDVISFKNTNDPNGYLCKIDKIRRAFARMVNNSLVSLIFGEINQGLQISIPRKDDFDLFSGNTECEILQAKSPGWRKGKLKLKVKFILEFIPDTPESPTSELDDIRKAIQNNQE